MCFKTILPQPFVKEDRARKSFNLYDRIIKFVTKNCYTKFIKAYKCPPCSVKYCTLDEL